LLAVAPALEAIPASKLPQQSGGKPPHSKLAACGYTCALTHYRMIALNGKRAPPDAKDELPWNPDDVP